MNDKQCKTPSMGIAKLDGHLPQNTASNLWRINSSENATSEVTDNHAAEGI